MRNSDLEMDDGHRVEKPMQAPPEASRIAQVQGESSWLGILAVAAVPVLCCGLPLLRTG